MKYVLAVLGLVGGVLIYPVVYFVLGAFTGWVFGFVFPGVGVHVVNGMNLIGMDDITLSSLPLVTATLALIGSFFRSSGK